MAGGFSVIRHADAAAFLARAKPWLLAAEAENNLILGVAGRLREGVNPYGEPVSLITVESSGEVCGCAWCTPPFNLGLTQLPAAALPALIETVAGIYERLPGVMGPTATAAAAAALWAERRGLERCRQMAMGIYALSAVMLPEPAPPGRARLARPDDCGWLEAWTEAMHADIFGASARPPLAGVVERLIARGSLLLWEDGEPASMAAAMAPTPSGIRVSHVYTPPARRGRGYASACVAALSQAQLDAGRRFCFLYADAANATSTALYRRIGYRLVAEALDVEFSAKETP